MQFRYLAGAATALALSACNTMNVTPMNAPIASADLPPVPQATSIFAQESPLPFHAPDFSKMTDAQWQPAIEEAIAIKRVEIDRIANNPAPPTFANTIVALELTGQVLNRAYSPFGQLVSANINPTLAAADEALAPQMAALSDSIYLNEKLFDRVKAVYDNRAAMAMTAEDAMLLETTYEDFVHRGAQLDDAKQTELKQINERLSQVQTQISQRITDAQNDGSITVATREELAGLSEAQVAAAAAAAVEAGKPGQYVLTLTNTTSQPLLASLDNREVRERLYRASIERAQGGKNDTTALILEVVRLRTRIAELFGTPDYATWQMYDRMAQDPATAIKLMSDMVPALAATQEREAATLNARIAQDGHNFTVQPWDWPYYAEKIRQERYSLNNEQIKQYFVVDKVLEDGVFYMANKLYGLTFEKRSDIPVYHPEVSVYTVFDHDGSELALFYFDPFTRESKSGGAWMSNFVEQSHALGLKPVIANTLNVVKPAPGQPALMTWDDVTTTFHEFGHALHGIFADQQYAALSGTNTARDWVEFPSQFHENFAALPEVLQNYAKHWQTGETIPMELVEAIDRSSKFNQGYDFGEVLAASLLDMQWHSLKPDQVPSDVMAFEAAALAQQGLHTELAPPRYKSPYYRHIFDHGYQAGYYAYTWTEMLHHDAYTWVEDHGGMTREVGDHIRATFLGQGHSKTYEQMFRDFTGRDPRAEPLLVARGLLPGDTNSIDGAVGAE